ncbi:MAG: helix-turn-helix domain-containing protein [Bacteroidota bacterium]|jgi:transcriptional regulator with XRE-family HTH domain
METVYENIRKLRTWKGLSQQNIADELKIAQRHYGRIENGKVDVSYSMLCKIASVLDTKLQILLGLEEVMVFNNYNNHQKNGQFVANNATDLDKVTQLYERLLKEKDARIEEILKNKNK